MTTGNGLGPLTPNGILTFIEYSRLTVKSTIELAVCNRIMNLVMDCRAVEDLGTR